MDAWIKETLVVTANEKTVTVKMGKTTTMGWEAMMSLSAFLRREAIRIKGGVSEEELARARG